MPPCVLRSSARPCRSRDAAGYVRTLFDQYAADFEAALVERLAYRGPALLRAAVERTLRPPTGTLRFAAMLDLGCGTGLAGETFRPNVGHLTGVDLSPAMVARAKSKDLYDRLATADLTDFLVAGR